MILTASLLLNQITQNAALAVNQAGLSNAQMLAMANLEMQKLVSDVLAVSENFLIFQDTIPVSLGTATYRVPYRAIGGLVQHVVFQASSGAGARYVLARDDIQDIDQFNATDTDQASRIYLTNNQINFLPAPNAAGSLLVFYPFMPSTLVVESAAPAITSFTTNTITVASLPNTFTTAIKYDIIDNLAGNGIVAYDLVCTNIAGSVLTFASPLPTLLAGQYIAQAQQSPVPMIPEIAHGLLAEMVVARIEMIRGSPDRVKASAAILKDIRTRLPMLLGNRIKSKPKNIGGGSVFRRNRRL